MSRGGQVMIYLRGTALRTRWCRCVQKGIANVAPAERKPKRKNGEKIEKEAREGGRCVVVDDLRRRPSSCDFNPIR